MAQSRNRRSIRLQGYDYTQNGAYFVTICTHQRAHLFGQVVEGVMVLSDVGQVVQTCWDDIPGHFPMVELDAFVVMPNHLHGIIVITDPLSSNASVGAQSIAPVQPPIAPSQPPDAPVPPPIAPIQPPIVSPRPTDASVGAQYIAPVQPPDAPSQLPIAPSHPPVKRGATPNNVAPHSLGAIVRTFKAAVTRHIHRLPTPPDHPIWQRNYHDHIIRHEADLQRIREYIVHNPARWHEDSLFT
ncbi:MAG: transposase [Anaerolineae bacterium]